MPENAALCDCYLSKMLYAMLSIGVKVICILETSIESHTCMYKYPLCGHFSLLSGTGNQYFTAKNLLIDQKFKFKNNLRRNLRLTNKAK